MIGRLIATLVTGAIAGFLAGEIMHFKAGLTINVILGVVGSMVGGYICYIVGIYTRGWIASTVISIAGACLVVYIARKFLKAE